MHSRWLCLPRRRETAVTSCDFYIPPFPYIPSLDITQFTSDGRPTSIVFPLNTALIMLYILMPLYLRRCELSAFDEIEMADECWRRCPFKISVLKELLTVVLFLPHVSHQAATPSSVTCTER
jgi:hypothetical protein